MISSNEPEVLEASLIICSRNRPALLDETVKSVLAGTSVPYEIVILYQSDLLTWMVHARSEYRDLAADRGVSSDCPLRNSLFFNLWRLELEHAMPSA